MSKKIISVVIPVYNAEKFIKRSVYSIINQKYPHWELILINDGSTDNSENIIKEIIELNPKLNIKYKKIKNSGPSTARNIGLKMAKGDYICFLDSDDCYDVNLFQEVCELEEDFDICYFGWCEEFSDGRKKYYSDSLKFINNLSGKEAAEKKFNREIWLCNCNEIYKRDLLIKNNIQYPDGIYAGEDACFIYSALLSANKVVCLEKNYFINAIRETSLMHAKFSERNLTEFKALDVLLDFIKNSNNLTNEEKLKYKNMFIAYKDYVKVTVFKKISVEYSLIKYFKFKQYFYKKLKQPKINLKLIKNNLKNSFYKQCLLYKYSKFLFFIACKIKYRR